jgi:hypothetical protein
VDKVLFVELRRNPIATCDAIFPVFLRLSSSSREMRQIRFYVFGLPSALLTRVQALFPEVVLVNALLEGKAGSLASRSQFGKSR